MPESASDNIDREPGTIAASSGGTASGDSQDGGRNNEEFAEGLKEEAVEDFIAAAAFSGPLPPPHLLRLYNEAEPGLAGKLVAIMEDRGRHEREIEKILVNAQVENMRRDFMEGRVGQFCAILVVAITTAGGVYAGVHGAQIMGSILGVGGIGSVVTAFLSRPKRSEEKPPTLPPERPA